MKFTGIQLDDATKEKLRMILEEHYLNSNNHELKALALAVYGLAYTAHNLALLGFGSEQVWMRYDGFITERAYNQLSLEQYEQLQADRGAYYSRVLL